MSAPTGQIDIDLANLVVDGISSDTKGFKAGGIQIDPYFSVDPSGSLHLSNSRHRQKGPGDIVIYNPGKFSSRQPIGSHGVSYEWSAYKVDSLNDRLFNAFRHVLPYFGNRIAHIVNGAVGIGAQSKFDAGLRGAVGNRGSNMLDITYTGNGILNFARHLGFKLSGSRSQLRYGNRYHRHIDIGALIYAEANKGDGTHDGENQKEHQGWYRIFYGPGGQIEIHCFGSAGKTLTGSPSLRKPPPLSTT